MEQVVEMELEVEEMEVEEVEVVVAEE